MLHHSVATRPSNLETLTPDEQMLEMIKCGMSCSYFINEYGHVFDPEPKEWVPFQLWPMQEEVLEAVLEYQQVVALKPRQVGLTWLILHVALWLMLFKPIAEILLFSKREDEAIYLIGEERLRGIYKRLPSWMQAEHLTTDDKKHLRLSNGSGARAFPSNAGDSYVATLAFIDEADLLTSSDLRSLLGRVKPTVEAGGQLVMISRPDKGKPSSYFKEVYRDAVQGKNTFYPIFVPWYAHPDRDADWYAKQQADYRLDDLHEQYPATDAQALSARTDAKLLDSDDVEACYVEQSPLDLKALEPRNGINPATIRGLIVYAEPQPELSYVVGADPAEGVDDGDDSSVTVMCRETGEEVAHFSGLINYTPLAGVIDRIGTYYGGAQCNIELTNHGHAVIQWMKANSRLRLMHGIGAKGSAKVGWTTTGPSKNILYSELDEDLQRRGVTIHNRKTYDQIISIERATLKAPQGMHDDASMSFALANAGRRRYRKPRNVIV